MVKAIASAVITAEGTTLSCTCGWKWDGKAWGATLFAREREIAELAHIRFSHRPTDPIPVWEHETRASSDGWTGD